MSLCEDHFHAYYTSEAAFTLERNATYFAARHVPDPMWVQLNIGFVAACLPCVKLAFNDADTDTVTDSNSPDTPTSLRPTRTISSRGCWRGCRCQCRGMRALLDCACIYNKPWNVLQRCFVSVLFYMWALLRVALRSVVSCDGEFVICKRAAVQLRWEVNSCQSNVRVCPAQCLAGPINEISERYSKIHMRLWLPVLQIFAWAYKKLQKCINHLQRMANTTPDLRLHSKSQDIAALRLEYCFMMTQAHGVNNLLKVVTYSSRIGRESNWQRHCKPTPKPITTPIIGVNYVISDFLSVSQRAKDLHEIYISNEWGVKLFLSVSLTCLWHGKFNCFQRDSFVGSFSEMCCVFLSRPNLNSKLQLQLVQTEQSFWCRCVCVSGQ